MSVGQCRAPTVSDNVRSDSMHRQIPQKDKKELCKGTLRIDGGSRGSMRRNPKRGELANLTFITETRARVSEYRGHSAIWLLHTDSKIGRT